jgi:hypothetical protein
MRIVIHDSTRHHLMSHPDAQLDASKPHGLHPAFAYAVMGPILADMLLRLFAHLHALRRRNASLVFFCARGGLVLRRALELLASKVGLNIQVRCEDFMVSRLAAARTALQYAPSAVAPLLEKEFAGRNCAEAARALANADVDADLKWDQPFSVARFIELTETTEAGKYIRAINDEQADLLRRHIGALRGTTGRVMICDTGVFGSIGRYLEVGVPAVDWHSTLLFRANYKRIPAPHFRSTTGVVSESDAYLPWLPATAALLYWQLMEAMLEPAVSSVRYYHADAAGRVVSDLEVGDWQQRLTPTPGSVLAGAHEYISELTPRSIQSIHHCGRVAWNRLRHMIVFPTHEDVALLAVGRRQFDFGINETAEFTSKPDNTGGSLSDKLAAAHRSMWPEGELRKQFPRLAYLFLLSSELSRLVRAFGRQWVSPKSPCSARRGCKQAGETYS